MKSITLFYLLVAYIFIQFCWWAYLLISLQHERWQMIIGEGIVFFFLLCFGAYLLQSAIKKEIRMNKQQKNFLLSVTHELKSPLASIKLYLQTILKHDLDKEKQRSFLLNSLNDIERLDDLAEKMLLATKIENRSYSFPKAEFNFSEMTGSLVDRLQLMNEHQHTFDVCIAENIYIRGDRFALASLVNNLLENAIKYSNEHSIIGIELKEEEGQIHLFVSDEGKGISENERRHIFEKFYRSGDEYTRTTKGTGLGLFIVKQVADNHRAQIQILNNKPQGTVFHIIFNTYES